MKPTDFNRIKPDQEISIMLRSGEHYTGKFKRLNSKSSFLEIRAARRTIDKTIPQVAAKGITRIYLSEIDEITFDCVESEVDSASISSKSMSEIQYERLESSNDSLIEEPVELSAIVKVIENPVYIFQTDRTYYDAIQYLSNESCLGISCQGLIPGNFKHSPTLLIITSLSTAYVFDIQIMGIPKEVLNLVTNRGITKVCYNSLDLIEFFKYKHGVEFLPTFDVSIGFLSIVRNRLHGKLLDYNECVATLYPEFNQTIHLVNEFQRCNGQLDDKSRIIASYQAGFLIPMYKLFPLDLINVIQQGTEIYFKSLSDDSISTSIDHVRLIKGVDKRRLKRMFRHELY